MRTLTISLPQSLKAFVEQQVATQGYGNVSEYFRSLLREAQAREAGQRLDAQLCAGLSADSHPTNPAFWSQLRAEARRLIGATSSPAAILWPAGLEPHRAAIETLCREHAVRELALVGASTRDSTGPITQPLEFAVHLGEVGGEALARAYAKFSTALGTLLARPIDLIEIGSMGPTRLRRLLEQTRLLLYRVATGS
jgi:antitoxin ParD1/3/4